MGVGETIGAVLAVAVGIAVSPVPVAAVILMLFTARARTNSLAFLLAWVLGITTVATVVLLIPGMQGGGGTASDRTGWVKLALGVALLLVAARQWRRRPARGEDAPAPRWMERIDTMGPGAASGLGLLLSAANPKNLVLAAAGGVTIAAAALSTGEAVVTVFVFVAIAASTVIVPVVGYLVAGDRLDDPLQGAKDWLIRNNGTVMAVLLLVFGVSLVGDALRILTD